MCRPPCCNDSGSQGSGIAAVALITLAALVAAKIGPKVASIVHTVLEVIRLAALTVGLVVALAVITWAAFAVTRWQFRRKVLTVNPLRVAASQSWERAEPVTGRGDCLACGDTGTVLRAIGGGRHQPGECPVCEPVTRVG
jgi:hypothetical protein